MCAQRLDKPVWAAATSGDPPGFSATGRPIRVV